MVADSDIFSVNEPYINIFDMIIKLAFWRSVLSDSSNIAN